MVTALSPPLALNSETLGQGVEEGVGDSLGEAGEEVQACSGKRKNYEDDIEVHSCSFADRSW